MRFKVVVTEITQRRGTSTQTIVFAPVDEAAIPKDQRLMAGGLPLGRMEVGVDNPALLAVLQLGKTFTVDITTGVREELTGPDRDGAFRDADGRLRSDGGLGHPVGFDKDGNRTDGPSLLTADEQARRADQRAKDAQARAEDIAEGRAAESHARNRG